MNAPPSVPLFAADRPHSKCNRRVFHFQFLLIGKAFTEPRVQRVVLLIQKTGAHAPLSLVIWWYSLVIYDYSMISVTTPDPTVLPPSLIAKRSPSSIATGVISSISITTLSPGMHISVPSGSFRSPVTSVVLR